jgi:hypothetical protein
MFATGLVLCELAAVHPPVVRATDPRAYDGYAASFVVWLPPAPGLAVCKLTPSAVNGEVPSCARLAIAVALKISFKRSLLTLLLPRLRETWGWTFLPASACRHAGRTVSSSRSLERELGVQSLRRLLTTMCLRRFGCLRICRTVALLRSCDSWRRIHRLFPHIAKFQ